MELTRRDALKAGVGVGTFALAGRIAAYESIVRAQAQANEPRLQLGSDYFFDDDGDNLKISHETQGDIFVYDPTADQITTLKPLSALITDALTNNITGTDDTEETITDYPTENDDDFADRTKITTDVAQSSKTIATITNVGGAQMLVLVGGSVGFGGSDATFQELVHFSRFTEPEVVNPTPLTHDSPADRIYTRGNGNELQLEMSSGTYDVRTRTIEVGGVDV